MESPISDGSRTRSSDVLINGIWVPKLRGTSNYDAWLERFEEAAKAGNSDSWRILTGQMRNPIYDLGAILSDQEVARIRVAKSQRIDPKDVTADQVQGLLDSLRAIEPFLQGSCNEALSTAWFAKELSARELLISTISEDLGDFDDFDSELPQWPADALKTLQFKFSNTGYLAKVDIWAIWLNLRFKGNVEYDGSYRKRFVKRFKSVQKELEEKIGQPISPQVEICQFTAALQDNDEEQSYFANFAAQAAESGDPIDMTYIYTRFLRLKAGETLEW